jgi:hypothetical protein
VTQSCPVLRACLPPAAAIVVIVTRFLPLVFGLASQKCARKCADNSVAGLVTEESSAYATSHGAHEAAFTFLRVVGVRRVALISIWVARVASIGPTLAVLLLAVLLILTVLLVLPVLLTLSVLLILTVLLVLSVLLVLAATVVIGSTIALVLLAMLETTLLGR